MYAGDDTHEGMGISMACWLDEIERAAEGEARQ